jgi:hypothetical protein
MKFTLELILLVLLLWLGGPSLTLGQISDQTPAPTSPRDAVRPTEEPSARTEQPPLVIRVAGINLHDNAGSPIGRIENLVIDPSSGRIDFIIADTFFPTNSNKLLPIPWKAISHQPEEKGIVNRPRANQIFELKFPRTKLQEAPRFDNYRWPDMGKLTWREPIYRFYEAKERDASGGTQDGSEHVTGGETNNNSGETASKLEAFSPSRARPTRPIRANDPDFIGPRLPTVLPLHSPGTR